MNKDSHRLVLARHGQSEGNHQNICTGWRNLPLTSRGEEEARLAGLSVVATGGRRGRAATRVAYLKATKMRRRNRTPAAFLALIRIFCHSLPAGEQRVVFAARRSRSG